MYRARTHASGPSPAHTGSDPLRGQQGCDSGEGGAPSTTARWQAAETKAPALLEKPCLQHCSVPCSLSHLGRQELTLWDAAFLTLEMLLLIPQGRSPSSPPPLLLYTQPSPLHIKIKLLLWSGLCFPGQYIMPPPHSLLCPIWLPSYPHKDY